MHSVFLWRTQQGLVYTRKREKQDRYDDILPRQHQHQHNRKQHPRQHDRAQDRIADASAECMTLLWRFRHFVSVLDTA